MTTTLAMMMLTFAAPPSEGAWSPNMGPFLGQTFAAASSPWSAPPWVPLSYIMAAEAPPVGGAAPTRTLTGVGQ